MIQNDKQAPLAVRFLNNAMSIPVSLVVLVLAVTLAIVGAFTGPKLAVAGLALAVAGIGLILANAVCMIGAVGSWASLVHERLTKIYEQDQKPTASTRPAPAPESASKPN